MSRNGFSLVEVVIAIALMGVAATVVISRGAIDRLGVTRSARVAESLLARARLHAVATHDPTRVTLVGTRLETTTRGGAVLSRVDVAAGGLGGLDSVRLRPATIRFNARGHGSAGSIQLYRAGHGMRLVSNFVGRVRAVPFTY